MSAPLSAPADLEPTARLTFERVGGRTATTRCRAASPLKLLTPRHAGDAAWACASSHGGGLLSGDRVRVSIDVGPRARAAFTTQASTKIYPGDVEAYQAINADLAAGSLLVVAPDPIVCYEGARYRQEQSYALAPSASLVVLDWMTAGRSANDERWKFVSYETKLKIERAGALELWEAARLTALEGALPGRMGRFETLGLVALTGPRVNRGCAQLVAELAARPLVRREAFIVSAAPLRGGGALLRFAAESCEDAHRELRRLLGFVWRELGDDPWSCRAGI
jgi:urease accessory protein